MAPLALRFLCYTSVFAVCARAVVHHDIDIDNSDDMVLRLVPVETREMKPLFEFKREWDVLGPFQIGTREGAWGADPLEFVGGFHSLKYDPDATYRSSLPTNGTAKWSTVNAKEVNSTATSSKASLSVGYDNVDWDFLKTVYGWAAVQYQAWARGELVVHGEETQHLVLFTDAIMENWVDDVHYVGGDFYTFRRAPLVLHLSPGTHKIELRLWRDVRAFGGINEPTIDVVVEVQKASGRLELGRPGILLSDVVDGKLASPLASVTVRNTGHEDIEIVDIKTTETNLTAKSHASSTVLVAGQTRPLTFNISLPSHNLFSSNVSSVHICISYRLLHGDPILRTLNVSQSLTHEFIYSPHKVTFLHPSGTVSYAMLRAPAQNSTCQPSPGNTASLPVLIANHGAGLEADNPMVAHALDPVSDLCAWIVFPTGVTPWSGDDWHNWGFADLEAAVNYIPTWIANVSWRGPGVDVNRWIMTGHSNGGQGTWYALTHRPDKMVAAAPLSGYASIQTYVPYHLWQPADPRRTAIISASLNSYRHEMLMENAKGIPVLQQHGEIDDNVPAYNSRLLSQQLFQAGTSSSYYEFPAKNHWWDEVMTTDPLKDFYRKYTGKETRDVQIPRRLEEWSIVVGDPGDMGPKGGVRVLTLEDPGMYGRVDVKGHVLRTSNVRGLEFSTDFEHDGTVVVDYHSFSLPVGEDVSVCRGGEGVWEVCPNGVGDEISYRGGRQLGTMTAILRTQGPFIIRHKDKRTAHIALQISRNLQQYFYADSSIVSGDDWNTSAITNSTSNVITVCMGRVPQGRHPSFPVRISDTTVSVRDSRGKIHHYRQADDHGSPIGGAFLRPLHGERLELVVWGSDSEALLQASRLVPTVTGVGQPDFVVMGESARWRGVEGALAMGFFDHEWKVTASSVVN